MLKLLDAAFARLWKSRIFWLCTLGMLLCSAAVLLDGWRMAVNYPEEPSTLDMLFFSCTPLAGLFSSVFISLFLGTEYSDGTVRNKLIVGHTRAHIYLANFIVCTVACWLITAASPLVMLAAGVPIFGWPQNGLSLTSVCLLDGAAATMAFSALFTLLGMLNQNKAGTAVLSILTFSALLFIASYLSGRLGEPETYSGYVLTENGMEIGLPEPNPAYVYGALRDVFAFLLDFLPTGQGIQIANGEAVHLWQMPVYSLLISAATTIAGILGFQRKDIK